MGEDLKGMASRVYDMMTGRDEKKRERPPERRLFKPEEREIANAVASNKELLQQALQQLQDATEILSDRTKHESEKISAYKNMQTARNDINRLLVYGVSAPLKEGDFFGKENPYKIPKHVAEMHDLARKMSKDPSLLEKFLEMLKSAGAKVGKIVDDHSRLSEVETCEDDDGDGEGKMADSQLNRIADLATMIDEMVDDDTNLPEWVESKITKALSYMSDTMDYMKGKEADAQEEMIDEET
jgi:hypothetical protein